MDAVERLAAEAAGLLNQRRFGEAVQRYMQCLQADPNREESWLGLGLAITLSGRLGDLTGLAEYRQRSKGDGFALFYNVLVTLMTYRLHDHVLEVARVIGESSPYTPATAYQAGCVLLLRGDEDAAFRQFALFKRAIDGRKDLPIGSESPFNIAYRQGTLIEDEAYVAALETMRAPEDLPEIRFAQPPRLENADHVMAAACDNRYFLRYAEGLVESVAAHQRDAMLHLHVAGLDAEGTRLFGTLAARHPGLALNLSDETPGAYSSGAYFASIRFLIAPALIKRYARKLILLDVDVLLKQPLQELSGVLDSADFACFRHDGAGPCSRYPAVLTAFAATGGGKTMAALLGRFIASKLHIPWPYNWMLDQAALASVLRYLRTGNRGIEVAVLNDVLGRPYQNWLHPIVDAAKETLIRSAGT